jgi:23S rRNA pseudouridine1911/1915/1917 synthase
MSESGSSPDGPVGKRSGATKPAKSGAMTPKSSPLLTRGGKLDARQLRIAMGLSPSGEHEPAPPQEPEVEGSDRPATDPSSGPIARIAPSDDDQAVAAAGDDDDAPNRVVFVLRRDLSKRLDKYLTDRIPFMSRTQLQRLIDEGGVLVNTRRAKASTKLRASDRVEIFVPPPPPTDVVPQDIPIRVMFEDQHMIVLNKQPDILVHPARSELSGTLINALAYHFKHRSDTGGQLSAVGKDQARPGVVHRLDRNTSGLIIFAKSELAHWQLGRQFETRVVDKRYLAIVHGVFSPEIEVIDVPIGPHPSREKGYREKHVVRHDHLGKPSTTIARVRATFAAPQGSGPGDRPAEQTADGPGHASRGFSLLELELKTGRTHQIRVHVSHLGFPIVADDMYGGRFPTRAGLGLRAEATDEPVLSRVALHAATLAFRHPVGEVAGALGPAMKFVAPFPPDLGELLAALREMDPSASVITPPGATVDLSGIWV